MTRIIALPIILIVLLAGLGALPVDNTQAGSFADAWSLEDDSSAVERCSLQPVSMVHPQTGATMLVLRPSCQ